MVSADTVEPRRETSMWAMVAPCECVCMCVGVCLCESMSNAMLDATRTNVLMCAYVPSIAAGVNIRGVEDQKKLVCEKLKEHVMSLFKRFFLSSCSFPWSCKKNKEDKNITVLHNRRYSSTRLCNTEVTQNKWCLLVGLKMLKSHSIVYYNVSFILDVL